MSRVERPLELVVRTRVDRHWTLLLRVSVWLEILQQHCGGYRTLCSTKGVHTTTVEIKAFRRDDDGHGYDRALPTDPLHAGSILKV